MIKQMPVNYY